MDVVNLVFLIFLLLVSVISIFLILQNRNNQKHANEQMQQQLLTVFNERLFALQNTLQTDVRDTQMKFGKDLRADFDKLNEMLELRVRDMQARVDARLDKSFKETNETFNNVLTRLTKIDQAQKRIDDLSTDIGSLHEILNDKKARGAFGEVQLVHIFKSVFGVNDALYRTQYTLTNKRKVDLMLFAPDPLGNVAIDSKFPLENYRRMLEANAAEQAIHEKQFKIDLKKHIDDIADKYIIPQETAEYAIMFLPAEAVFAQINAYHQEIVNYAYERNIWLTSPTTLMALLTTLQATLKNMERDKYARVIREELQKLSIEFGRYQKRWENLAKHIDQVSKDVKEVNTTSDKIISRFAQIDKVEFEEGKINQPNNLGLIENAQEK